MHIDHSVGNSHLGQVVHRIQDVLFKLELVLHQFTCQVALCLAAGIHHSAALADANKQTSGYLSIYNNFINKINIINIS